MLVWFGMGEQVIDLNKSGFENVDLVFVLLLFFKS
jgi:hypothetical protein